MDHPGSPTNLDAIQANTALYGRRVTSPCRLTLAADLGGGLDGAWWPHATSIARELPDLLDAVCKRLGQVIDIGVNWSPFEGVPNLDLLNRRGVAATPGRESRRLRVMAVTGTRARADLLVVPWQTSTALATMVLRLAAGLPVMASHQQTRAFEAADAIVEAARCQGARVPAETSS